MTAKNGGSSKPEYRLPPLICGSPFIPVGLFIYGWTAQYSNKIHWIVPLIGTGLVGIGMIAAFMSVNVYLIDWVRTNGAIYAVGKCHANKIVVCSLRSASTKPFFAAGFLFY